MSGIHPSEEIVQQYVVDRPGCTAEQISHIAGCPECQAAVAAYVLVAEVLRKQPAPVFDFDLAGAVIRQVEGAEGSGAFAPAKRAVMDGNIRKRGGVPMAVLIAAIAGVPAWLFRKSAYFVFTDMSAVFYWVLLAAAGIVVGLFILRLHRKYQNVINLINK
jgi:anti-sigma factor RsiW